MKNRRHPAHDNHDNVMNCTYYIVFEQNYKRYQWWIDKKERIKKMIAENNTKQMEVRTQESVVTIQKDLYCGKMIE